MTALALAQGNYRPLQMPGDFELSVSHAQENPALLVKRLGSRTKILSDGLMQFDEPLIDRIARLKKAAISPLASLFRQPPSQAALIEGIRVADRLAEAHVPGVETLYASLSQWNTSPDPLVQIYLAGLYRRLNLPATVGPMMATLVHQSLVNYPAQGSPAKNITEEVGGTILQQFADTTAQSVLKQLKPWLDQMQSQLQQVQFSVQGDTRR